MKYFRLVAYTPYAGEELYDYGYGETIENEHLREKADLLMEECAAEWRDEHSQFWQEDGYDSQEDWEEDYYSGCGVRFQEIDYATYTQEMFEEEEEWEDDEQDEEL